MKDKQAESIALEIVENSPSVAMRVSGSPENMKTLYITKNIEAYGYPKEDFLQGRVSWIDLVHPDDREAICAKVVAHEQDGTQQYTASYRMVTREGRGLWVSDFTRIARDENGQVLYFDCIISDYTSVKETQDMIEDSFRQQSVLYDILQSLHEHDLEQSLQIILSRTGSYLDISRVILFRDNSSHTSCKAVYEWCNDGIESAIAGQNYTLNYKEDIPEVEDALRQHGKIAMEYGAVAANSKQFFNRKGILSTAAFAVDCMEGRYGFISFDECCVTRQWEENTLHFLANIAKLVSTALMRRENEIAVERMTYSDQLTGLVNRFSFDVRMKKSIELAQNTGGHGYVLFIDLDDFKVINEGYGHDYGDAMLVEIANYFRKEFGEIAQLFRFGGDEFVILVEPTGQDDEQLMKEIVQTLLRRSRHPWKVRDKQFYCTISIGVVGFPDGTGSVKEIMKNADIAMYQAKEQGKNNYVVYNPEMDNNSVARAEMEHRMREAIDNDFKGFEVYYQPLVDKLGRITGAEALLRWVGEDGQLILPGDFIPLAEYLGLIVPLGEFVLRAAAQECKKINRIFPDFTISVNVSVRQLQQKNFPQSLLEILNKTEVNIPNIVLEVTEGMMIQDMQNMLILLDEIRSMGLKVAMDDFGTGYSSLNNMREISMDIIKIDRSFIQDVATDAYSKSFIRLITDLGHTMGRAVCVEGVENEEQYHYCVACGADIIQGYYFWKPMKTEDFRSLLLGDDIFFGI